MPATCTEGYFGVGVAGREEYDGSSVSMSTSMTIHCTSVMCSTLTFMTLKMIVDGGPWYLPFTGRGLSLREVQKFPSS